jgi:hypothetical protein
VIEQGVRDLKRIIAANDGSNVADRNFRRAVDALVSSVYDEIGDVSRVPLRDLFDLFVIKVLYVGRQTRHADVVDYIAGVLECFLYARALFPEDAKGRPRRLYFSDLADPERLPDGIADLSEAYRLYADSALFLGGVFPRASQPRASRTARDAGLRRQPAPAVDSAYYVTTGRTMYRMSAQADHETCTHAPATLEKMAEHIDLYMDALAEVSERYLMGVDTAVVADKMLDAFNRHRQSGAPGDLDAARRYAALLGDAPYFTPGQAD